jgi:predicted DNA binding protein
MRKLIIELKLNKEILKNLDFLLDKAESIELIELLKLDFKQRLKMGIAALNMKEGYTIEDINIPNFMDMLTVLKQEGNRYIVLSKVKFYKKFEGIAKKFDIDIIWTTPSIFTKDKMTMSVIGNEENLKKFLDVIKYIGEVKSKSFIKATFNEQSILSCLTEKQKEMIIAAKNNGYYNYPRKINSEELSKIVGLSKPTVVQHLRKAESRIVSNILAGY